MVGQREVDEDGNTPRKRFGEAVRDARELRPAGKMSQTELARKTRTSKSAISRIERGTPPIPAGLPPLLDQIFETDGLFKRLYDEACADNFPAQYRRRMGVEPLAAAIAEWSPTVIPGLLQTAPYARALFRAGDPRAGEREIANKVATRMARKEVFRGGSPPDFSVIVCESVIRRVVGGPDVMRDQLSALLSRGAHPTTVLQVLPLDAGTHGLMSGAMSILTTPDGNPVVYTEGVRSGAMIDDEAAVRHLTRLYDVITASALSPDASASVIRELMEAL
ncbi:Scr1 family TA system antitoxin-like transcriptional regulator [Streptomyces sp. NBC_00872]|uniref:Scr1 family TA system antitoxin-like transcriptional regulator n=1 Tax=Streptomyces sp. NBC_00872 TaxID=2903686 RepID=UPI00386F0327|nr:helix-turn-helix transcriptional regulator [Streptomyces sp. NBC_00872]